MKPLCIDFDDLCDNTADALAHVEALKVLYPAFKCTLFTIPMRSTFVIPAALELDVKYGGGWLQLAPHGWRHTRGECLAWSDDETVAKINAARDMGITAPVFRAPAWLLDVNVYEACKQLGYIVASHKTFRVQDTGAREYVYNFPMIHNVRAIHGHLTPVCDNDIAVLRENGTLDLPHNSTFVHPQDVAVVVP